MQPRSRINFFIACFVGSQCLVMWTVKTDETLQMESSLCVHIRRCMLWLLYIVSPIIVLVIADREVLSTSFGR